MQLRQTMCEVTLNFNILLNILKKNENVTKQLSRIYHVSFSKGLLPLH